MKKVHLLFLLLSLFGTLSLRAQTEDGESDRLLYGFVSLQADFVSALQTPIASTSGTAFQGQLGVSVEPGTPFLSRAQLFLGYQRSRFGTSVSFDYRDTDFDESAEGTANLNVVWGELALGGRIFFLDDQPVRPFVSYTIYLGRPRVSGDFDLTIDDESLSADLDEVAGDAVSTLDIRFGKADFTLGAEYALTPQLGLFAGYTYRRQRLGIQVSDFEQVLDAVVDGVDELNRGGFDIDIDDDDFSGITGEGSFDTWIGSSFATLGLRMYF